ncbi:MAG: malonyl-CoA decarboxylase family protein [Labilithrix sp.]|nr:malonyl-CoA decarboxylase family protein [Labilithrix sp.]
MLTVPVADALPAFVARLAARFFDAPAPRRRRLLRSADTTASRLALALAVRRELLTSASTPATKALEDALRARLADALRPENLVIRPLDLGSPEALLDAVRRHDAVHPVVSEEDLERRLADDRAIYALVHKSRRDAALVFAEVALVASTPAAVDRLVDPSAPILPAAAAREGIFYGISNTEPGTAGLSLGTTLLDRMLDALGGRFPHVTRWATLSPMPGFRAWLVSAVRGSLPGDPVARVCVENGIAPRALLPLVDGRADEPEHARIRLVPGLEALARCYLESTRSDGSPRDPVARFHLGNGAVLDSVRVDADRSTRGFEQSLGVMASYAYVVDGRRVGRAGA